MPKVRLTHDPNAAVEVTDKQLIDLQRWGLVVANEPDDAQLRLQYGLPDDPAATRTTRKPAAQRPAGKE